MRHLKNTHPLKYLAYLEKELNKAKEKVFNFKLSEEKKIRNQFVKISSLKQEIKDHKHSMTEEELDIYYSIKEINVKRKS